MKVVCLEYWQFGMICNFRHFIVQRSSSAVYLLSHAECLLRLFGNYERRYRLLVQAMYQTNDAKTLPNDMDSKLSHTKTSSLWEGKESNYFFTGLKSELNWSGKKFNCLFSSQLVSSSVDALQPCNQPLRGIEWDPTHISDCRKLLLERLP